MSDFLDRSSSVVQRYGGTVNQFTGDGIMVVFGAPLSLEDHTVRASLAALDIQQLGRDLGAEVGARDGVDLQLRVGLNSVRSSRANWVLARTITRPSATRSGWRSGWSPLRLRVE